MSWVNWKAVRVVSPPSSGQMHALVVLKGARTVREWGGGPMVVVEAIDGEFTTEPFLDTCEFVGVTRADVAATILDANQCSVRARVAAAIISSLMGQSRFLVSSKGSGEGHVVKVGVGCCDSVMRTNLVLLYRHTVDTPFDDALQLHPHVNRELGYDSNCTLTTHEVLFVDVQFKSGTPRRLYAELTPGQIAGFAADATKTVFWEPPASYSEISEHPGFNGDYRERFPCPGWESYPVVVKKVCEVALSHELRRLPVDFVKRLL